ncbi:MAG: asparagine synthase B [Rivularia sp. T60_A2020_040]|nr:asparagine synthase B [Rivularia sp. T60_A2020_040]
MCGITGIWGQTNPVLVKSMMDSIAHRGPDAEGLYASPNQSGNLGHRRLSIIDPDGGDQPIYGEVPTRAIIANGEIYNFSQLRSRLKEQSDFHTSSDSEAILKLYEERGMDAIEELDGMYAFAIADGEKLLVARDPIGIKPLYYGEIDGAWIFASELKAISLHCQNVREFPPGSYYHSDKGFSTFYNVPNLYPDSNVDVETLIARVRQTVEESVIKRLMSDVPLGAFLSGGLDSSIIAAVAKQHQEELHTFSVGIAGSRDLEAARLVSTHLGTIHHEYIITPEEVTAKLPEIIYHLESFDQDLVRSAIPCYFTSRMAAEYVKVILTGEGADELFAGYSYYKQIPDEAALHQELHRSVSSLHNINLQRVDRMTMAHAIEGRVPFLDLNMIELAQQIPANLKLVGEPLVEKWILRKAFEDMLPSKIVWRKKEQFDEGSGTVDMLQEMLSQKMNQTETQNYQAKHPYMNLRSPEECFYHKIFMDVFENSQVVSSNVARWSERPV